MYGQKDYQTPVLDKLAADGVRLTHGYANSAVCSATRFALITGRYQYRLRGGLEEPMVRQGPGMGLPPAHATLPSLLRGAGYQTALIGKWHLGHPPSCGPLRSGYDYFLGNLGGAVDYFTHKPGVGADVPADLYEGETPITRDGYYTQVLADEACGYIGRTSEKPFFLSLHFTAPHWPWLGPDDEAAGRELTDLFHYDGGNLKTYGKMVRALDAAVGQVLSALEKAGKRDNTVVVFTSDNGGERFSNTWPFTGQKTELLEGGLRVPTLICWPAGLKPQVSEQVMATMVPTLLAAAGVAPDAAYPSDGENLLPVLKGEQSIHPRTLYWRYKAQSQRAVRDGDWKYLKINDNEFLFDVAVDASGRTCAGASRQCSSGSSASGKNGAHRCCPSPTMCQATASRPTCRPTAICRSACGASGAYVGGVSTGFSLSHQPLIKSVLDGDCITVHRYSKSAIRTACDDVAASKRRLE